VTHQVLESEVDAYLDGELAQEDARALEAHLAQCPECVEFRDRRLELRSSISARIPAFQAPDLLRQRVRAAAAATVRSGVRGGGPRGVTMRRWSAALAVAASLVVVAVGSWRLAQADATGETLANDVLTSHVRSLMPGHLTDVPSTDQHTVKPWFNGRLDYSPPVYDFAARGYPLLGGRLDYVGGRPVAALVYGRRQHLINVFLWPTPTGARSAPGPSASTRQGYHMLHWTSAGYSCWAVSDLGLTELEQFKGLLQQADSAAAVGG
jgi:anti-sigma factor RsiW